jgi:S1-C subfamily serine protease
MLINTIMMFLATLFMHKAPTPSYPAPQLKPAMIERVKHFTVLISNEGWEGVGRGTGVLIDSTHVLTCQHMIGKELTMVFTYPLHTVVMVKKVAYQDPMHDVAIFELSEPVKLDHYATFNSTTTVGQPIMVVGNTLGAMVWFVSYGIISDKTMFYDLTTATSHGGNSGGPWVDLEGRVVAITDWGLEESNGTEEHISGGINGETLLRAIKEFKHPQNIFELLFQDDGGKQA